MTSRNGPDLRSPSVGLARKALLAVKPSKLDDAALLAALRRHGTKLGGPALGRALQLVVEATERDDAVLFRTAYRLTTRVREREAILCRAWRRRYAKKDAGHLGEDDHAMIAAIARCEPKLATATLIAGIESGPDALGDFRDELPGVLRRLRTAREVRAWGKLVDVFDRGLHGDVYANEPIEARAKRLRALVTGAASRRWTAPNAQDPFAEEKRALAGKNVASMLDAAYSLLIQRQHPEFAELVREHEPRVVDAAVNPKLPLEVRLEALKVLDKLGIEQPAAKLAPMFDDKLTALLGAAAELVLAKTGARVAAPHAVERLLASAVAPGDWSPQYDAVIALRYFDDARVVPALVTALAHAQGAVRREAIIGLGEMRAAEATPHIIEKLEDGGAQAVTAASVALEQIATPAALAALADDATYARALKLAMDSIDGRFACAAIAQFRLPTVDDDLIAMAAGDDYEVIEKTIKGLIKRRCARALPALAPHYLGEDGSMHHFFLLAVGLATAIEDPDARALDGVAKALAAMPVDALADGVKSMTQVRYGLVRLPDDERRRFESYRARLCERIADATCRDLVAKLFSAPST